MTYRIELLDRSHDRKAFDCGEPTLNNWLAQIAFQHQSKQYSRTYVLTDLAQPKRILGYYALTPHEVAGEGFPGQGSPPRRLPCILLGRLAVNREEQGGRLGEVLLYDAIERTRRVVADAGGVGLVADALNERAVGFYEQYGFVPFKDDPLRLVLILKLKA